jgi:prephenate dehydratase
MVRTVAYQGAIGAFSEEACRAFLPESAPIARESFAGVIAAVQAGEAQRGILPLRNSVAGDVPGVEALIRESGLILLDRHRLPVRMHLLAVPEASLDSVRIVASHPMALAQCRKWLDESGFEAREAVNTAVAAQRLAESGDTETAVLASESAAKAYGLAILRRDVHDSDDNATTFGILGRTEDLS